MEKNNHFVNASSFCGLINMLAIGLLVVAVILYAQNNSMLINMHKFVEPITDWIISPIFFVRWIVQASNQPELAHAYIVMVYLIFIVIFLNVYFSTKNPFSGSPNRFNYLTLQGFFEFLEEHIYSKQNIPVSLSSINGFNKKDLNKGEYFQATTYKELLVKYLNKIGIQYFGIYIISGFLFFPLAAYDNVNNTELTILPFWFAVILFTYIQVRFLVELLILMPVFTTKVNMKESLND